LLLEGRNTELAGTLAERMHEASEATHYELAAKYRDLRKTVNKLSEQQKMATSPSAMSTFLVTTGRASASLCNFSLCAREHRGRREFYWEDLPRDNFNPATFLSEVLGQYYSSDYVPKEIYVPVISKTERC